jgi:hypothetical protein
MMLRSHAGQLRAGPPKTPMSTFRHLFRPRSPFTALVLIFIWPTFNIFLIGAAQSAFGVLDYAILQSVALRLYLIFFLTYVAKTIVESRYAAAFPQTDFLRQFVLYLFAGLISAGFVSTVTPEPPTPDVPRFPALPLLFLLFQMLIFVAAITINAQRERNHAMALNLRQAQVNLLRAQSNPHFLFNTLNLLATEIGRSAETAREIVYDLADLLRESMKAGERAHISIAEEMRLATLYLQLQQKRFPSRFSFEVNVDPDVSGQQIPALLLQPGVENAIKHGVARTKAHIHLTLAAERADNDVLLTVADTGGLTGAASSGPGDGLRILGETLELYYPAQHSMKFDCSEAGATLSVRIPFAAEPELLHG